MHRRKRGVATATAVRIAPNLILELHDHPLTYYSKLEASFVCDRCHRLCFDEGWQCDEVECAHEIEVSQRASTVRPFFCVPCYTECARLQSECLMVVVADKATTEQARRTRTPNLRTNWRSESALEVGGQDAIVFESLITAVVLGNLERVKEIVDHTEFSRHIQIEDTLPSGQYYGRTPLLLAAEGGHRSIVTLLLERGAGREVADVTTGMTPLMVAAYRGHSSVVDELVHGGVAIDRLSPAGYGAVHFAAVNGHAACIRRLMKFGADILVRTHAGRTALVIAACNGHLDTVAELTAKMDLDAVMLPDREGYTALDMAIARDHNAIVNHLQDWIKNWQPPELTAAAAAAAATSQQFNTSSSIAAVATSD